MIVRLRQDLPHELLVDLTRMRHTRSAFADSVMMYSVNWHSSDGHGTESRTTVHLAGCHWPQRYGDRPNWRHFETLDAAVTWAQTSPYPLNYCPCVSRTRRIAEEIAALQARLAAMKT